MSRFPESHWAVLVDEDKVIGHVALTFRIWHEAGTWQGVCSELGVPSFGESPGETLDNVVDATIGYLNEIEDHGERERVFAEQNVMLLEGEPASQEPFPMAEGESVVSRLEVGLRAVG